MTDPYFVCVKEPDQVRINLLESSKFILHTLRINQKITNIREKKISYIQELKNNIKELSLLLTKLESLMPHHELFKKEIEDMKKALAKHPKKISKKSVNTKPAHSVSSVNTNSSELDKINKALADIEKKLNGIN